MTTERNEMEDLQQDQVDISQNAEQAASESTSADASPESLRVEIERLKDELALAKEQTLRALADTQNARRRAEQDVEKAHKFGVEKFVNDMIPVADNLERSVMAAKDQSGDFNAVLEGVELTLKTMIDGLKRHNVVQLDPTGEPFDPQLHQAMTAI